MEQLYPDYLLDRDGVQLCIPRHEHQDVQIGIYLYDISEYSMPAWMEILVYSPRN